MSNGLREFAERIRKKVILDRQPMPIIEARSKEEADRLVAEYEAKWGPERDVLVTIWGPREEMAEGAKQSAS